MQGACAGKVIVIGAGPGAPDLLSLRAWRALQQVDAILYDALLPRTFLVDAGLSLHGKQVHWLGDDQPHWSQNAIHRQLAHWAHAGLVVARLKNGDPFLYGRGGEELEFLSDAFIPWEVIPGPSAFSSVLAEAGFSLTHRVDARSFAVISARCAGGETNLCFPKADSLVIYMGATVVEEITRQLLRDGWPGDTPAALVEKGCLPGSRCICTTLEHLPVEARQHAVESPCLLLVGAAAGTRYLPPQTAHETLMADSMAR